MGILDDIGVAIQYGLRSLAYMLCSMLYNIVIYLYKIFDLLCKSRLLNVNVIDEIATRIGLVLGLVMLFIVIFSFINSLINPDYISDKAKSPINVVKKVIIVIVMFGLSNFAFNALFEIQNTIVNSNIVTKILIPAEVDNKNKFGDLLATRLFTSFYTINSEVIEILETNPDAEKKAQVEDCSKDIGLLEYRIYQANKFEMGEECLNKRIKLNVEGEEKQLFIIDFSYILSLVTAGFLIYFLFSYCISVGVRTFQIAFLEIISPLAFVGYLSPKNDNLFTKWWKIYFSTYINLFIRIAIINFVVFLIAILLDNEGQYSQFWQSINDAANGTGIEIVGFTKVFIMIIMIFGLLTFAKKAPDLLKDLFGSSASKIGYGASLKNAVGLGALFGGAAALGIGVAGRVPGMFSDIKNAQGFKGKAGALAKGIGGIGSGAVGGAFRGAKAGFNKSGFGALSAGQQAQAKANLARVQRIASGKGVVETAIDGVYGFMGMQSGYESYDRDLSMSNNVKSILEGEDPIKRFDKAHADYRQACAARGIIADNRTWDDKRKELLEVMYNHGYNNDNNEMPLDIEIRGLSNADGSDYTFVDKFESNMGIYQTIHVNEKRSGKDLSNWKKYKADNNEIKTKIAKKTKGSK